MYSGLLEDEREGQGESSTGKEIKPRCGSKHCEWLTFVIFFIRVVSKWGGGGFGQKRHGVVSWGEMTNNKGFFVRVFLGEVLGVELGGGCVRERGVLLGSFAGFGQRVHIGVWPGCQGFGSLCVFNTGEFVPTFFNKVLGS